MAIWTRQMVHDAVCLRAFGIMIVDMHCHAGTAKDAADARLARAVSAPRREGAAQVQDHMPRSICEGARHILRGAQKCWERSIPEQLDMSPMHRERLLACDSIPAAARA